jgi:hypothetical protein
VLAHAGLLFLVRSPIRRLPPPPEVIYELTETPARFVAGGARAGKRGRAPKLGLKDLGIGWSRGKIPLLAPGSADPDSAKATSGEPDGDPGVAEGDGIEGRGGNILGQMKRTAADQVLYERIDEVLDYPDELKEAGAEGTVKAELRFDSEGNFLKKDSRLAAASRFLRVHVMRVLRRAFAERLPETYVRGGLRVRCLFEFDLIQRDGVFSDDSHALTGIAVRGNYLGFRRTGKRFGEWKLGPFAGDLRSIAGGALGIDPGWFVDQVTKLTSNKAAADPLQKYRDDPDW